MRWQGPAAPPAQPAICQTLRGAPALPTSATSAIQPVFDVRLAQTAPAPSATTQGVTTSQPSPTPLAKFVSQVLIFPWVLP